MQDQLPLEQKMLLAKAALLADARAREGADVEQIGDISVGGIDDFHRAFEGLPVGADVASNYSDLQFEQFEKLLQESPFTLKELFTGPILRALCIGQLVSQLRPQAPEGYDPRWWIKAVNGALEGRGSTVRITDLDEATWARYISPLIDYLEDENRPD